MKISLAVERYMKATLRYHCQFVTDFIFFSSFSKHIVWTTQCMDNLLNLYDFFC